MVQRISGQFYCCHFLVCPIVVGINMGLLVLLYILGKILGVFTSSLVQARCVWLKLVSPLPPGPHTT